MLRKNQEKQRGELYIASGILAAFIASLCCIGPLLLVALGIGGIAVASAFEPLRPLFASIAVIALALAWRRTLKRSPCSMATPRGSGKRRTFNISVLGFATILSVALLAFPMISGPLLEMRTSDYSADSAGGERFVVSIPSMDCPSCALTIESKLAALPGVQSAHITYPTKRARITYDPSEIDQGRILQTIEIAGFPTEPVQE